MISNCIVHGFVERLGFTLPEFVISLSNLPDMSVDRDRLAPTQAHQADAIRDFWPNALQGKKLFVCLLVGRMLILCDFRSVEPRVFRVAKGLQPVTWFLLGHYPCRLSNVFCAIAEAKFSQVWFYVGTCQGLGSWKVVKGFTLDMANERTIVFTKLMRLDTGRLVVSLVRLVMSLTICDILEMLLLLLQMKHNKASQASWLRMRTPMNCGALLRKLGSACDHWLYKLPRSRCNVK